MVMTEDTTTKTSYPFHFLSENCFRRFVVISYSGGINIIPKNLLLCPFFLPFMYIYYVKLNSKLSNEFFGRATDIEGVIRIPFNHHLLATM
jgi:hypothetical protein